MRSTYARAAKPPAAGKVITQANTMSRTVVQRTAVTPFKSPMPIMAELLTCVVDTGNPSHPEQSTSVDVVRFADNPSAWSIRVTFSANTSVTRSPPK